jgi:hypothetical protein
VRAQTSRAALLRVALLALGLACQGEVLPAPAPPAPPPPPPRAFTVCDGAVKPTPAVSDAKAAASFQTFSKGWITKLRNAAAKRKAVARTRILDVLETELRPTGNAQAPFVGVLRYCEQKLSCASAAEASCSPASNSVVTELFRYQGGKWVY